MSFKEFLLKNSKIEPIFIEDYYKIFNEEYDNDSFVIDSEVLRDWLDIPNKQNFELTIKKMYRINVDYIIEKVDTTGGHGGHNKRCILLTPNAAKDYCLTSKGVVGEIFRKFFIEIESEIVKYYDLIIDGLQSKIDELENKN